MEESTLKPSLRFKGYTDAWEQRSVSSMFKITRGLVLAATIVKENRDTEYIYPVYSSQTRDNGLLGYFNRYLFENAITWTTDGANAGTVRYRDGKFYCTNVCGVLLKDKIEPNNMVSEALNRVAKKYVSYVGNPKLMNNTMSGIEIKIPDDNQERTKISNLFIELDSLITLHQRKYEELQNAKKSLLQKMFPEGDNDKPSLRFKGYTDAWEQSKLNENVSYITSTLSISDAIENGKYPLFDANNSIGFCSNKFINQDYITIIKDGSGVGRVRLLPKYTYFIGTMGAMIPKNSEVNFDYALLEKTNFSDHIIGATIPHVYFSDYGNMEIKICSLQEQTLIGNLFSSLDSLITLHQRKYEKLQNIKKSLLERMFI